MPHHATIDMTADQQQDSSDSIIPITVLLEMVARPLGRLVCGWAALVLVQSGMVATVETKDLEFGALLVFLVLFRGCRHNYPQAPGSLTGATQFLSADYLNIANDIRQLALPFCFIRNDIQQLALSNRFIRKFFYCTKLVTAMASVVLSVMRIASQDFGKTEVANKGFRDFALKVFYGLTLAEALVFLFPLALTFSSPRMANSVGPADGPADGPRDGPGDGSGDGPGGGPGDGPSNPTNDYTEVEPANYSERPADGPSNQSNDFNSVEPTNYSEGLADSLPNLLQRRGIVSPKSVESAHPIQKPHPACRGEKSCTTRSCIHNSSKTLTVLG